MKELVAFMTPVHTKTSRDYVARVARGDKAECAEIASRFGQEYWDGERKYGYGGYTYDGRWAPVAAKIVARYGLTAGMRVLDVGCGKAFLLHEIREQVPGIEVVGIDVSPYAIENAKPEVRPFLHLGQAQKLDHEDRSFDLVLSLMTLHNLALHDLVSALREISRVTRKDAYISVESYRDEREKANLLAWQLTCQSFFTPDAWRWIFDQWCYTGDYEFLFFG